MESKWLFSFLLCLFPTPAWAELRVRQPAIELGEIRGGQRLTQRFDMVNLGHGPVEITEVRPGCGCLVPTVEPRILQPGQRGTVTLAVNTLGQPAGTHTWKATVSYRAAQGPAEISLELRATVINEVVVQPASLTLFTEGPAAQEITLTDLRPNPLTITGVAANLPGVKTRVLPAGDASGRRSVKILLEVSGEVPAGRHEGLLQIFTDDPLYGALHVPLRIIKQPRARLSYSPRQLTFVAEQQPLPAKMIRLWTGDDRPVVIAKVSADHPGLLCTWAPGPGQHATVKVQVDARRGPLLAQSAVHIEVRSPVAEIVTIPVRID